MTHWQVLIVATITWIVWIPACSFEALAQGRSGSVSILPGFPVFPLAAWGLAYAFHAAQWPIGTTLVGVTHVILLIWMLVSIVKSKRALRARNRDQSPVDAQ